LVFGPRAMSDVIHIPSERESDDRSAAPLLTGCLIAGALAFTSCREAHWASVVLRGTSHARGPMAVSRLMAAIVPEVATPRPLLKKRNGPCAASTVLAPGGAAVGTPCLVGRSTPIFFLSCVRCRRGPFIGGQTMQRGSTRWAAGRSCWDCRVMRGVTTMFLRAHSIANAAGGEVVCETTGLSDFMVARHRVMIGVTRVLLVVYDHVLRSAVKPNLAEAGGDVAPQGLDGGRHCVESTQGVNRGGNLLAGMAGITGRRRAPTYYVICRYAMPAMPTGNAANGPNGNMGC
jgi:hypothetical protein